MGARNMRLLRVRRSAAVLCWAMVWAVLLSVQLHPRQPVGQSSAEGAEGGTTEARLVGRHFQTSGPTLTQGPPEKPLSPLEAGWNRCGACVGRYRLVWAVCASSVAGMGRFKEVWGRYEAGVCM